MSGFDRLVVVPPNAAIWCGPTPPVHCLDCDRELAPFEAMTVAWKIPGPAGFQWHAASPLCQKCAVRRDERMASE